MDDVADAVDGTRLIGVDERVWLVVDMGCIGVVLLLPCITVECECVCACVCIYGWCIYVFMLGVAVNILLPLNGWCVVVDILMEWRRLIVFCLSGDFGEGDVVVPLAVVVVFVLLDDDEKISIFNVSYNDCIYGVCDVWASSKDV